MCIKTFNSLSLSFSFCFFLIFLYYLFLSSIYHPFNLLFCFHLTHLIKCLTKSELWNLRSKYLKEVGIFFCFSSFLFLLILTHFHLAFSFLSFFSRVHPTLQPALSICPSVGWSVGQSVGLSVRHTFTFFNNFISLSHLMSFNSILSHSKSF